MADEMKNGQDIEELLRKQKGEKGGQASEVDRNQDVVDTGDFGGDYNEDEDIR